MTSHMSREIAEQPAAARRTLDALLPLRSEIRALMGSRRRVLLVARGSSDNAAIYGRYLLETTAGVPAGLAAPSVATHYGARLDLSDTLVVAVSQSGETTEIVQTQAWAASCGAATVAVTNGVGSTLAIEADLALVTRAGPELAVPATKTYLTQLVAMAVARRRPRRRTSPRRSRPCRTPSPRSCPSTSAPPRTPWTRPRTWSSPAAAC